MKRTFDLIVASIGLLFILPVLMIIALLIKSSSPGPILFTQIRVGQNGRLFRLYKFRTMIEDAAKLGTSVTHSNDTRITSFGKTLRKTKLDEIPQLFNVIKGEMSLVGPRPDVPEIIKIYTPEMRRILKVRPGITSKATLHLRDEEVILASVNDPDKFYENVLVPLKVRLAMEHVEKFSFSFDLKIFYQTIWMLTLGRWHPIEEVSDIKELKEKIFACGE